MGTAEVPLGVDAASLLAPEGLSPVRRIVRPHAHHHLKGASVGQEAATSSPCSVRSGAQTFRQASSKVPTEFR
jgi:hypothetical protein